MKKFLLFNILLLLCCTNMQAQVMDSIETLTYNEFLGYVKKYHPVVKQANLEINRAQAALMMARGGFDPKIEVDFEKKEFKNTEYYNVLNSSFKIPTWYGIEIKAGFDNSEGVYLNPQNTTPNSGLTSLGVTVPLGQGLFINQRMADVRMAKIQLQLSRAERQLQATNAIYEASIAYFNWSRAFNEVQLYEKYLGFAATRYDGVIKLIEQGDKPAIDSIEAGIVVRNRELGLEDAKLKLAKARLELSNYIWIDNVPVELSESLVPELQLKNKVQEVLQLNNLLPENIDIQQHPKIIALQSKLDIFNVERRLKANMLLPRIDAGYHYLSEPSYFTNYRLEDYKIGLNFSFPLFLRKERGSLNLTKLKIADTQLDLDLQKTQLKNKIAAQQTEIESIQKQQQIIDGLVRSYDTMLNSEERLFSFGESSLFLINTRENNLVSAQLSRIQIENRLLVSNAEMFKIMANAE